MIPISLAVTGGSCRCRVCEITWPFLMTVSGPATWPLTVTDPFSSASLYHRLVLYPKQTLRTGAYIILRPPIPKLRRKNLHQRPPPPSLLAVRIIRIMIRPNSPQPALVVIRRRPRITRRDGHLGRFLNRIGGRGFESCVDGCERHDCRGEFSSPGEVGNDPGGWRCGDVFVEKTKWGACATNVKAVSRGVCESIFWTSKICSA